jgi:hypothetical protein
LEVAEMAKYACVVKEQKTLLQDPIMEQDARLRFHLGQDLRATVMRKYMFWNYFRAASYV